MIRFSPRFFVLPLLALVVIGSLPAPADTGAAPAQGCGPGFASTRNPAARASFVRFEQQQSEAATAICRAYHNSPQLPAAP